MNDRNHAKRSATPPDPSSFPALQYYAETNLPTEFGHFRMVVFRESNNHIEHMALIVGNIEGGEDIPTRVHSECFTGEVLHSYKCDCRQQLHTALQYIAQQDRGILIYLRQEGRGIGLGNKIRAYALQEEGHDTVDANRMLGFADDLRTYEVAAHILHHFHIRSIALLTNNPQKMHALEKHGICIHSRIPLYCSPNPHSLDYFKTKRERMGHLLDIPPIEKISEYREASTSHPTPVSIPQRNGHSHK